MKNSFFSRLKEGLTRTRHQFTEGVARVFLGKKAIEPALFEALEAELLAADVGVAVTQSLLQELTQQVARQNLTEAQALWPALKNAIVARLLAAQTPWNIPAEKPYSILMIGINGAGKTTTVGKLAHFFKAEGRSVMLAAGDTFRAAAIEQLQAWGERTKTPVIAQTQGADSASVVFDALQAAKARNIDVLLADTAGRLHSQSNLMEELKKIKRVMSRQDANAPHETWLVLDAGNGQNAIRQAQEFHQSLGLTGLILTKLDGTAKGGAILAIVDALKLPIRFIGVGEGLDDLRPFEAESFAEALFAVMQ